jgi:photosystem II stability/assembly factor-like uncharacterized protein
MTRFAILFTAILCSLTSLFAQKQLNLVSTEGKSSLRGMSITSENVIWVSGSNGTVGRSVDGGNTWQWMVVAGFEKSDFRDIEAFDSSTALVMAIGNPALIFKTKDGGKTWKKVFERNMDGMFLDAMDFKNEKEGICIGDPLVIGQAANRFFYIIRTTDGGDNWHEMPMQLWPPAQTDEAIFSASGTNISFVDHPDFEYVFITGGKISNIYFMGREGKPNKMVNIPINQGIASTGAFSFATDKLKKYYCIGGDYKEPHNQYDNMYYSNDAAKKWGSPSVAPPFGYRSCIRIVEGNTMIACGPNGVDLAQNAAKEWKKISNEGFNVCMVSPSKKYVFLAGENGKIGRLEL